MLYLKQFKSFSVILTKYITHIVFVNNLHNSYLCSSYYYYTYYYYIHIYNLYIYIHYFFSLYIYMVNRYYQEHKERL